MTTTGKNRSKLSIFLVRKQNSISVNIFYFYFSASELLHLKIFCFTIPWNTSSAFLVSKSQKCFIHWVVDKDFLGIIRQLFIGGFWNGDHGPENALEVKDHQCRLEHNSKEVSDALDHWSDCWYDVHTGMPFGKGNLHSSLPAAHSELL